MGPAPGQTDPSAQANAGSQASRQALFDAFIAHLACERRLSPRTVDAYARDVHALLGLLGEQALDAIEPHQARRAVAQLHARGLDGKSLARMLSAWRSLFRYLVRDHGCACNPFLGIRPPKSAKRLPKALSPDEAARLLEFEPDGTGARRDRAMFELFYSSGLRLSELIGLRMQDVDVGAETVRVTGKGDKTRIVPVGRLALEALRAWLAVRAAAGPAGDLLFPGASGKPIHPRTVQRRLQARALAQGISQPVHPHMLRHSFASHVLQSSGDLRAVQEMLGHASISSTQIYTHLDFQHLAQAYDAAHPRARKPSAARKRKTASGGGPK
jgi:integrase/recombinase XerC